jgi:glyoxylase-like metal-dependent hydrolase (beta-lactamase superfamily II)
LQEKELLYAMRPLPPDEKFYEAAALGFSPPWMKDLPRFTLVNGDYSLLPGLDLVFLPGHTPGFQGVLVQTRKGGYMIAGDCLGLRENWPESADFRKAIPSGLYYSLSDYYASFEKIARLCDDILPGHDAKVFEQTKYPRD